MTPQQIQIIMGIVALCIQYGLPAVTSAMAALNKEIITLEDIQELKNLVKPPEQY